MEKVLNIEGMVCMNCVKHVDKALREIQGIKDVDVSMFINDLPNKKDTRCFSTLDASGSTSQAAGITESMEAGSHLFLLDEDTSATNFMVRDAFMQQVIQREKEPITLLLFPPSADNHFQGQK